MNYTASLNVYEHIDGLAKSLVLQPIKKVSTTMKKSKDHLTILIKAENITALRAALNSITQNMAVYTQMRLQK